MDDQVQKPNNQNIPPAIGDTTTPTDKPTPVQGGSSLNKEREVVSSIYITPSESEPILHEDVEKAGVKAVSDELRVTTEQRAAGIQPTLPKPEVGTPTKVQLPIDTLSEAEAKDIVKKGEGSNLDVGKHFEGIYHASSILGLALLKLKGLLRTKLLRQQA